MKLKNLIFFPAFLFFLWQNLAAQNLNGYQISITENVAIELDFKSEVTYWGFLEQDYPYAISFLDVKSLMIQTSKPTTKSYNLIVEEGGRKHRLVLVYKSDVGLSEQTHDFSDLNNLKRLADSEQGQQNAGTDQSSNDKPNNAPAKDLPANTQSRKKEDVKPSATANDESNFYTLMDEGDAAISNHQLDIGKTKYEQALKLKPDNPHAQDALTEVNKLIAHENDTKYNDIIAKANSALSLNEYDQALQFYNDALAIRSDDPYATGQIKLIQQKKNTAKTEAASREKDSLFNVYLNAGDKYVSERSYDAASISYNEALKIKPDNTDIKMRLNEVHQKVLGDSIDVVNKRKDDAYSNFMLNGNKFMRAKSYSDAIFSFNEALKIKPADFLARSKIDSIQQAIVSDSLQAERNKNSSLYDVYIKAGNDALKDSLYDEAKNNFNQALQIKPDDAIALGQIKKANYAIQLLLLQKQKYMETQKNQEREDEYNAIIAKANAYYDSEMYEAAKEQFAQALALNTKDTYSKNKLLQINSIIAKQKSKMKEDSLNNVKYVTSISKADQYFSSKDYTNAKTFYKSALKYKDSDEYAIKQLSNIDVLNAQAVAIAQEVKDSLEKVNEHNKQYNDFMDKAKTALSKNDYVMARGFYVSANEIKPGEQEPINKIAAIDDSLNEIFMQKQLQETYDSLTTIAGLALADSDYKAAVENLSAALKLNLADSYYVKKQIVYANQQMAIIESINNESKKVQGRQENFDSALNIYNLAKRALVYGKYDSSLFYYQQFVSIADAANDDLTSRIAFSKEKVIALQDYLQNQKDHPDTVIRRAPDISKLPPRIFITYYNPKNPQLDAIYKKYPDIGFNLAPGNQLFDTIDISQENKLKSKDIMSAVPQVIAEHSNDGITLTCENIIFRASKVYFKFMLQNANAEEFLTGSMLLIQQKDSGNISKMLPVYISNYPIILTNQKPVVVYITKDREIKDSDYLNFEVHDRLNKIKIELTIPGSVYNKMR